MSEVPAGWYADPLNAAQRRYWDGGQWTEATAPVAPPSTSATAFEHVDTATPTHTFAPHTGHDPAVHFSPTPAFRPGPEFVAETPRSTAFSPITAYTPAPAQYSYEAASVKKGGAGKVLTLLLGGVVAIAAVGYLVNTLVSSVATPRVTETAALALDTSAKSDAASLGEYLALYYVDHSGAPPVITVQGANYVINVEDSTPIEVRVSKGVAFGGVSGTGSSTWCVWVTAAEGQLKDFQFSSLSGLGPGHC